MGEVIIFCAKFIYTLCLFTILYICFAVKASSQQQYEATLLMWWFLIDTSPIYTWREPPTMGKQLVNFITCGFESSAPFFVIYKAMLLCNSYTCQLYILFCFRTEVEMSGIAVSKYSTKKAFDKSSSFINICMTRYQNHVTQYLHFTWVNLYFIQCNEILSDLSKLKCN
jgi:hypothetical protein